MDLYTILTSENVVQTINNHLDYLLDLIPEIKYMIGFDHKHPHHHLDVFSHTLEALRYSENDFEIRLCLLLHDIGKPFSYTEGEVRHYENHAETSAIMSETILKRIGLKEEQIKEICYLIQKHDTPLTIEEIKENYELSNKRYKIQYCDALAHNPNKIEKRKKYLENIQKVLKKQ